MSQSNVGGRPVKYTPERLKSILNDISHRIPYLFAAEANGITDVTLYDWINKGKEDAANDLDTPLARFSCDIKRIEAKRIQTHLNKLRKNVKNWQADAWILERRWYKHFGANALQREQEERLAILEDKFKAKE